MKTILTTTAALAFSLSVFSPLAASAEVVNLVANDGSSTIAGDLISFEDNFYTIKTTIGEMRISAARVSCEGAACPTIEIGEVDVRITGSDTVGEGLMPLLIAGYADHLAGEAEAETGNDPEQVVFHLTADGGFGDPIGTYLVTSHTSDVGFAALLDKTAEVAISTRRIHPDEARALRNDGGGNMVDFGQEHVIAVDSLLVVVHPSNPVNDISIENLARIFNGEFTNWSELGGPNADISIYSRADDSGTWEFFKEHVLHGDATNADHWTIEHADEDTARAINDDPFGIGYLGHAFQRGTKALNLISSCGIRSFPDSFSAKTEDYPLERRIYAYNRSDITSAELSEFLEYSISDEADGVVSKSGFINLAVARTTQAQAEGRMQDVLKSVDDPFELLLMRDMVLEMIEWDRLSSTFRFGAGSTRLDNKAELDMQRLVAFLEGQPAGTQVSTVGFTDSDGAFSGNQNLSVSRAELALDALREHAAGRLDHIEFTAQGFGELSPAACNDSADGKRVNRRVEIWIRN